MSKPEKRALHGWLVLDKPAGITSAHAVAKVKRLTRAAKIGHAGTLDPLASGVLPLALGEATKTASYAMDGRKTYRFTIRWGEERNTDDAEGETVQQSAQRPDREQVVALLPAFIGTILQTPPAFSAIKIEGERAYDRARAGEKVEMLPRKVELHDFRLLNVDSADEATFIADCGKGTYIRALARDMGRKLGCFGHISMLRRSKVGKFDETHAISLDLLEKLVHSSPPENWLHPVQSALDDILAIEANSMITSKLKSGSAVVLHPAEVKPEWQGQMICAKSRDKVVALCRMEGRMLKPVRVFNY